MNYVKYMVVSFLLVSTAGLAADEQAAQRQDKVWTARKLPAPIRYQGAAQKTPQQPTQQRERPILTFRPASFAQQQDQSESPANEPVQQQQVDENPVSQFDGWPRKSVGEIKIDLQDKGVMVPEDRTIRIIETTTLPEWKPNLGSPHVFAWAAPDIRYRPLYFEDVALERYGQTHGLRSQPVFSGINMLKSFASVPLQMHSDPPFSCDYPLGYCRPGDATCTVRQKQFYLKADR